jgi:hypothetical protein
MPSKGFMRIISAASNAYYANSNEDNESALSFLLHALNNVYFADRSEDNKPELAMNTPPAMLISQIVMKKVNRRECSTGAE